MAPGQLDTVASRIAAVVAAAKRPVTAPFIQGVVRGVTNQTVDDFHHQMHILFSQLSRLPGNYRQSRGHGPNIALTPPGRNANPGNGNTRNTGQIFFNASGRAAGEDP